MAEQPNQNESTPSAEAPQAAPETTTKAQPSTEGQVVGPGQHQGGGGRFGGPGQRQGGGGRLGARSMTQVGGGRNGAGGEAEGASSGRPEVIDDPHK